MVLELLDSNIRQVLGVRGQEQEGRRRREGEGGKEKEGRSLREGGKEKDRGVREH